MVSEKGASPLVSVVMPVFNGARTFERAIDSILSQTYQNIEVLVCDNASFDGTDLIAKSRLNDRRVVYVRHSENIGAVANFLYGVSATKGDYVLIAGDDDYWDHEYIAKMLSLMDGAKCIGMAQSAINRTKSSGELVNVCDLRSHASHLVDMDHSTLRAARLRLKHLLFSERCADGYNPCNMLVLALIDGPVMREAAKRYPANVVHDRAFMAAVVIKRGWRFVGDVLMTKVSVHDKPYSVRRAPGDGKVDILTRDKTKYSNRMKIVMTLNHLLRSGLSIGEVLFVVLPQYFYLASSEISGFLKRRFVCGLSAK
jgi:glycosyltransferase involved in cell wall biosynthesis